MPEALYVSWFKTFADVAQALVVKFMEQTPNEKIRETIEDCTLKFVNIFIKRRKSELKECEDELTELAVMLVTKVSKQLDSKDSVEFDQDLVADLIETLPSSASLVSRLLSDQHKSECPHLIQTLIAGLLTSERTPSDIYIGILQKSSYHDLSNENVTKFSTVLLKKFAEMGKPDVEFVKACAHLTRNGHLEQKRFKSVIKFDKLPFVIRLAQNCDDGGQTLFSVEDRIGILRKLITAALQIPGLFDELEAVILNWMKTLSFKQLAELILQISSDASLPILTKLVVAAFKYQENDVDVGVELVSLISSRLCLFSQYPDPSDREGLDLIMSDHDQCLSSIESAFNSQLDQTTIQSFDYDVWKRIGKGLSGMNSIVGRLEPTQSELARIVGDINNSVVYHVLMKDPLLAGACLSPPDSNAHVALENILLPSFVKAIVLLHTDHSALSGRALQLILAVHVVCVVYLDGLYYNKLRNACFKYNEHCRALLKNLDPSEMTKLVDSICTVYWNKDIPLVISLSLKVVGLLLPGHRSVWLESKLDSKQKWQIKSVVEPNFSLDECQFTDDPLLPFVVSLERESRRLRDGREDEDLASVLLFEVKEASDKEDSSWLFSCSGNPKQIFFSAAILRLGTALVPRIPDLPRELRDFLLCGMITVMQSFTSITQPSVSAELLAGVALEFMVHYDRLLSSKLQQLKGLAVMSEDVLALENALDLQYQEWDEFFGNSAATYVLGWFMWIVIGTEEKQKSDLFSSPFKQQLYKTVRNTTTASKLFSLLKEAPKLFYQRSVDKTDYSHRDFFDMFVNLMFSDDPDLQLISVYMIESVLLSHFSERDQFDIQFEQLLTTSHMPKSVEEGPEPSSKDGEKMLSAEQHAIEYKLAQFFVQLFGRLDQLDGDQKRGHGIDPHLVVWHLLIKTVKNLDVEQSAELCSQLESNTVKSCLFRITSNLPISLQLSDVEKQVEIRPDSVLSFWKQSFQFEECKFDPERLLRLNNYALWLYFSSLQYLPALVRDWFKSSGERQLKQFTVAAISPILINSELNRVGNVKSHGFSVRSRPATREIVAKYKMEELSLEVLLTLPEDFPLSNVAIEHDKRNVIHKGITHKLHLNLFAFVNTRNGSIVDGILQWKKNVEKTMNGVEDCAICMSTVSTRNYRLPDMKCRQCTKKFHSDCMLKWIQTSQKPTCPLCRNEFY